MLQMNVKILNFNTFIPVKPISRFLSAFGYYIFLLFSFGSLAFAKAGAFTGLRLIRPHTNAKGAIGAN